MDRKRMAFHEAAHAVVASHLGFVISRVSIQGEGCRVGAVDCSLPGPNVYEDDSAESLEARREAALKNIAVYFAGAEGEFALYKDHVEEWSQYDFSQAELHAIQGIRVGEDNELLEADHSRSNGWTKWDQVDEVLDAGRTQAKSLVADHLDQIIETGLQLRRALSISPKRVSKITGIPITE